MTELNEMMIQRLLSTLDDIVRASGNWKEKGEKILASCSDDDKTNLMEFVTWFDDD
jgi:hypothetical protein